MKEPLHGVQTNIFLDNDYMFHGVKSEIKGCRYHSWSVSNKNLPEELNIIAKYQDQIDVINKYFKK